MAARKNLNGWEGDPANRNTDTTAAAGVNIERRDARLEDYQLLRSLGLSHSQIAARLGVTKRSVERYSAQVRQAHAR